MTTTMNSKRGFTFNFNQGGFNRASNPATPQDFTPAVRPATPRQIEYYMDLCRQKNVTPQNFTKMSYDELTQVIAELRAFYPASPNQIQMIKDKITNLQKLGATINHLSDSELSALTGGRTGTASKLIESLINMERQYADQAPPTDSQLQFLVSMYLCPDVPFEDFDIKRKYPVNHLSSYSSDASYDEQTATQLWRKLTPDEFAKEIFDKMSRREASKFIDDYRGVFHTWKTTRIRPEQERYIRKLEKDMATLSSPNVVEWAVNPDGSLIQVIKQGRVADENSPTAYVPLDDMELMMMSTEDASRYIDILKAELGQKEMYQFGETSDGSLSSEMLRKARTRQDIITQQHTAMTNLIFKLEAVAGYNCEEAHDAVNAMMFEDNVDPAQFASNKQVIREFMFELLETDSITFEGLVELTSECELAREILIGKL